MPALSLILMSRLRNFVSHRQMIGLRRSSSSLHNLPHGMDPALWTSSARSRQATQTTTSSAEERELDIGAGTCIAPCTTCLQVCACAAWQMRETSLPWLLSMLQSWRCDISGPAWQDTASYALSCAACGSPNAEHAVQISACSRSMKPQQSPLLLISSLQRSGMASPRSWQPSQAPRHALAVLAPIISHSCDNPVLHAEQPCAP